MFKITETGLKYLDKLLEIYWQPKSRGDNSETNEIRKNILLFMEDLEGKTLSQIYFAAGSDSGKVDKEIDYLVKNEYIIKI